MLQLDPFFGVAALLMILKSLSEKVVMVSEASIVTSLPIFAPRKSCISFFFSLMQKLFYARNNLIYQVFMLDLVNIDINLLIIMRKCT